MPSIKELKTIYASTPIDQPILLEGGHGCGKSESVKEYWESEGYRVMPYFLGQMSDAGDVLGLPDRFSKVVNGVEYRFMDFCPPAWWPIDENEKVVLFLDELNRAKPELMNVIMDLVLNRKLAGRNLPNNCRIIAAQNPAEGGLYMVEDLETALLDRFNKYDFDPTIDEWLDWAVSKKVNKLVMGFISRNNDMLDPPKDKKTIRANTVYTSRRSWKRVSDILNQNPNLVNQPDMLMTILKGVIGTVATSSFSKYIREFEKGIQAGVLITRFHERVEEFEMKLSKMNVQDIIALNREIIMWFAENESNMKLMEKGKSAQLTYNLQRFLDVIPVEAMAEFFGLLINENRTKTWVRYLMTINPEIGRKMMNVMAGTK